MARHGVGESEREREREMCSLYVAGWPVDTWWPRGVRDKVQNITANPKRGKKPEAAAAASFLSHPKGSVSSLVQGPCQ